MILNNTIFKGIEVWHGCACGVLLGSFMEYIYGDCGKKAAAKPNPRAVDRQAVLEIYKRALL